MDMNIVTIIGTLGGVLLGFLLNEMSAFMRHRREDKQLLRRALFNLMNLHHFITPPDLKQVSLIVHNWLQTKDPDAANSFTTQELRELLQQTVTPLIEPLQQEGLETLCSSYEQAISEIAKIDPILAFSLSGRSRAPSYFSQYFDSIKTLYQTDSSTENQKEEILQMVNSSKNYLDGEMSDLLKDDIRAVARLIGWKTLYRVSKRLKRSPEEPDPELKNKLIGVLDEILLRTSKSDAD